MDICTTKTLTTQAPQNNDSYAVWEPQVDSRWEIAFSVFYFFEDLRRIRDELKKTWTKYKSGHLDIISATVVTTAAFELVRQTEVDICTAYRKFFRGGVRSFIMFAAILFTSKAVSKGDLPGIPDKIESQKTTSFEEFIFRPTAHTLLKFRQSCEQFKGHRWPIPVVPMRKTYNVQPELLGTEITRKREEED